MLSFAYLIKCAQTVLEMLGIRFFKKNYTRNMHFKSICFAQNVEGTPECNEKIQNFW